MRVAPTFTADADFASAYTRGSSRISSGGLKFDNMRTDSARMNFTTSVNGTVGDGTFVQMANSKSIEADAEL